MRLFHKRVHACFAGLALVTLIGAPPSFAGPGKPADASAFANVHIDNFGRINDNYYRGAQPRGQDFQALSGLGVKLVIDLAAEGDKNEDALAHAAGMRFVRIPMTTHDVPTPAVIAQFMSLVTDPANEPVYVHCIGGRHRTGVMTAIYRMTVDGWTNARAESEMKQFKFGADFLHPEFKAFVDRYTAPVATAAVPK